MSADSTVKLMFPEVWGVTGFVPGCTFYFCFTLACIKRHLRHVFNSLTAKRQVFVRY